jgi:hypothetical protein
MKSSSFAIRASREKRDPTELRAEELENQDAGELLQAPPLRCFLADGQVAIHRRHCRELIVGRAS